MNSCLVLSCEQKNEKGETSKPTIFASRDMLGSWVCQQLSPRNADILWGPNPPFFFFFRGGGKLVYLQLELFYLQLSFFAYSPLRCFLD